MEARCCNLADGRWKRRKFNKEGKEIYVPIGFPNLPRPSYACAVVELADEIYVLGGWTNEESATREVYILNADRRWEEGPRMLSKRDGFGAAKLNEMIYAVGGHNGSKN